MVDAATAAGDDGAHAPLQLLLYGSPELGYSWRDVMVTLATDRWVRARSASQWANETGVRALR